jgi:hypothetical protein
LNQPWNIYREVEASYFTSTFSKGTMRFGELQKAIPNITKNACSTVKGIRVS